MSRAPRVALLLFVAFAAFYAATTRGAFVFGDDVLYFQVTEAIVERGGVEVASPTAGPGPGRAVEGRYGRSYAKYGLGFSLAAIPAYAVARELEGRGVDLPLLADAAGRPRAGTVVFGTGLTNAVVGALAVVAVFWLALELGFGVAVAACVAAALGGAGYFAHYAVVFLSEPLSALLLTVATTGALRAVARARAADPGAAVWAALSGTAAGFALLTRVAHVVAVAPIGLWLLLVLLRRRREVAPGLSARVVGLWSTGAALGVAAVAAYNLARFGSLLESGYGNESRQFTTPVLEGLAGLIVSPGKGALWYAPPLLLALPGWLLLARRRSEAAALLASVCAGGLGVFAAYYQWWGGGAWGPRFVVPVLPLLLAPAGEIASRALSGRRLALGAGIAAALAGVLVALMALRVPFERHQPHLARREQLPENRGRVASFWRVGESPLVSHAGELPIAARRAILLLVGREPLPGSRDKDSPGLPDLAFARYGSHALLQWTRFWLLVAGLAGAAAAWTLLRIVGAPPQASTQGGKALLSRPPQ